MHGGGGGSDAYRLLSSAMSSSYCVICSNKQLFCVFSMSTSFLRTNNHVYKSFLSRCPECFFVKYAHRMNYLKKKSEVVPRTNFFC